LFLFFIHTFLYIFFFHSLRWNIESDTWHKMVAILSSIELHSWSFFK
jgi:hypothetical protein